MRTLPRESVLHVMRMIGAAGCSCPAHSHSFSGATSTTHNASKEYAVEMACSNIRYGNGVTQEVGMDLKNMKAKHVILFTDKTLSSLSPVTETVNSLQRNDVKFTVYDEVRVEPTDGSFQHAIDFMRGGEFDSVLAVGGGSVIDTAKAANLLTCHPESELLDFVNAPIGKGMGPTNPLLPLIAVPTTAGTGSETTGEL